MYKVETKDNKELYRLQDLTKKDNVDESKFHKATNKQGKSRLECKVIIMHTEEFETLQHKQTAMKEHVEDLSNELMQRNNEIKRLEDEIEKYKHANADDELKLRDEKFNMLQTHTDEVRRIEKDHQTELDKLKETHENHLIDIDERHEKQLRKLRTQYTAKVDEVKEDLIETITANDKARDKLRGEMLQLKETHKDEVITLQNTHHKEVEKLQHVHSDELQALREQHSYDMDHLKKVNAQLKQEHIIEVNEIKTSHIHESEEMRAKFLKLFSIEHAKDLSDFNDCGDLPFYIKPFARGFVKNFNEFKKRKELNTPKKIVETYELTPSRDE